MLQFIQPEDLHFEELTDTYGRLIIEPLEGGMGTTLGNSLRRILISMIPGAAVTRVRFQGKYHEYDTIEGVREDVIKIIMNLKSLALRLNREEAKRMYLDASGEGVVKAGDIEVEAGVTIVDPDHIIAHLDDSGNLSLEMDVEPGMGYRSAEENKLEDSPLSVIPIDSDFSPVRKVNFSVGKIRAKGKENCDRLVVEIETDGGVRPEEATGKAANILSQHFIPFKELPRHPFGELEIVEEETEDTPEEFDMTLEELGFNQRACNLLREKGVERLEDLVQQTATELLDIHGFGEKTLQKVKSRLDELNFNLADGEEEDGS